MHCERKGKDRNKAIVLLGCMSTNVRNIIQLERLNEKQQHDVYNELWITDVNDNNKIFNQQIDFVYLCWFSEISIYRIKWISNDMTHYQK